MQKKDKIFVAGHRGLIGSAIVRCLKKAGFTDIITCDHSDVDLTCQSQVEGFFRKERPGYVFLAAGKVGGVYANNTYRADFIYKNLEIQNNVIHQSFLNEVKKLIFFSCSCVYPKYCPQPMREEYLLSSYLEPTSQPFAIAKLAGMEMCESYNRQYGTDFISVIPTNVYGPNQNYEPMNSLVVPAMIRKFHEARTLNYDRVTMWGTGRPSRDFLFVDDLADAAIFLIQNYSGNETFNIGTRRNCSILELAEIICSIVGYKGEVVFDQGKLDGVSVKLQDISKLTDLGWEYRTELEDGLRITYADYVKNIEWYR